MSSVVDWFATSSQLSLESQRLEKKFAPSVASEGYRHYQADEVARNQNARKKKKQIVSFQTMLKNISTTLRSMENDKFDCSYFQNLLEDFEASMAKEYEDLEKKELVLLGDLSTLNTHIDQTMTRKDSSSLGNIRKKKEDIKIRNDKISSHKAEIGAIERKLTSLGDRLGGWDPRDHDIFLRVWTQIVGPTPSSDANARSRKTEKDKQSFDLKSKAAYQLRKKLVQAIQMKNEDEIEDHLIWFIEVENLLIRKRDILAKWKAEKEEENPVDLSDAFPSPLKSSVCPSAVSERSRENTKIKLEKWQKQKEEYRAKQENNERDKEKEKKKKKERELAERQRQNKVLVQNWIEEKKAKEKCDEKSESPKLSTADLESLRRKQEQDIEKAKLKREKLSTARAASTGRLQRQKELAEAATESKYKNAKAKLLKPTKASLSNKLTPEDLEEREHRRSTGRAHDARIVKGGYDLKFCGRAIPAWTKGAF